MNDNSVYEETVLEVQQDKYEAWIDRARAAARDIARRQGTVSSDDIWEACPPPQYADARVMGAVFHPRKDWVVDGYQRSRRRACHSRPICVWRLAH